MLKNPYLSFKIPHLHWRGEVILTFKAKTPYNKGEIRKKFFLDMNKTTVSTSWLLAATTKTYHYSRLMILTPNSTYSNFMYHTLRSPRSRCPHYESGPPHGCLHTTPVELGAPQKTSKALVPKPPCPTHSPRQYNHNSLSQTCTSGLHLQ